MEICEHTLEGECTHKLDPKCRVSVPSEWRDSLRVGKLRLLQSTSYELPVLRVITQEEYTDMITTVDGMDHWTPAQKKRMKNKLHSRCQATAMSEQGKLSIPKAWCEKPEIEAGGQVKLVGRGTFIEIINLENYTEMLKREDSQTDELNKEVEFF